MLLKTQCLHPNESTFTLFQIHCGAHEGCARRVVAMSGEPETTVHVEFCEPSPWQDVVAKRWSRACIVERLVASRIGVRAARLPLETQGGH